MAQQKPEDKVNLEQVLKLVNQLSPREQDQLMEEMKLKWLRHALEDGEQSINQYGARPVDEVFSELKDRYESRKQSP
ncbi:MAG: hypothetical protein K2Y22_02085 [Candidatus Obscuribacterales bacterium]|nr:hypothetical protein [Candidatus Obscuribacterales bacterium]